MLFGNVLVLRRLTGLVINKITSKTSLHSVSAKVLLFMYSQSPCDYGDFFPVCIRGFLKEGFSKVQPLLIQGYITRDEKMLFHLTDQGRALVKACIYEAEVKAGVRFSDLLEGFEY